MHLICFTRVSCSLCRCSKYASILNGGGYANCYYSFRSSRSFSSNAQVSVASPETQSSKDSQLSLYNFKKNIDRRAPVRIKRMPFMKNLFIGKYDKDVLAFPEIHNNKEIDAINKMADVVRKYVLGNVNSEEIDRSGVFPEAVLDNLKKLGLFGSRLPVEHGGLGSTATEHIRLMEACSLDSSLAVYLNTHHSIAMQGILQFASDDMKELYLSKLTSGELTATLCISEQKNENDISAIHTVVTKTKDNEYLLTGKKTWVWNGSSADLFLVLARNPDPQEAGKVDKITTMFLVERNSPGVVVCKAEEKLGIKGANVCSVEFHETPVSSENIIGNVNSGYEVLRSISLMNQFHIGAFTSGLAKAVVELATDHCINNNLFQKPLTQYENSCIKVGSIVSKAYAMESMTYLTAGLFDSTEDPDLNLEYSAIKVFCTEGVLYCANEILNLLGPGALLCGHPVERILRDCYMWLILEGKNDMARQYITFSALDHLKHSIADDVQKLRNPMFHPKFTWRKVFENYRHESGNLKLSMDLQGYVHPSLQIPANHMEYSVQRLKHAFEVVLQRMGPVKEISNSEANAGRLADMAIEIFAMSAVCSRASRAYCIGLPCADTEISLAMAYCQDGYLKVTRLHDEIVKGPAQATDLDLFDISRSTFQRQGYCLAPPFTRTY